jgi:hypothetical protein
VLVIHVSQMWYFKELTFICQHLSYLIVIYAEEIIVKKFEDTKGIIRSRKSNENRQYNGQKKKDKQ